MVDLPLLASTAVRGWGGHWAEDPVEKRILLPWLSATAFVHSFGDGPIGPAFLAFFLVVTAATFGLAAWRRDPLRHHGGLDSAVSREEEDLRDNVLFVAISSALVLRRRAVRGATTVAAGEGRSA